MTPKVTICLWFDKDAHEAASFYAATFPDSHVTAVHKAPGDYPGGKKGTMEGMVGHEEDQTLQHTEFLICRET